MTNQDDQTHEDDIITNEVEEPKWLKPFTEYLPLAVFGLTYWQTDIITATKAIVVVTLIVTAIAFAISRKIAILPLVTAGILAFFGGLTVYFDDAIFIKIKPTIIQLIFAAILGSGLAMKKLWLKNLFGSTITMPDFEWKKFTIHTMIFFIVCAALNELVWRTQTETFWVNFKIFGLTGLSMVFFMAHAPMFSKYMEDNEKKEN